MGAEGGAAGHWVPDHGVHGLGLSRSALCARTRIEYDVPLARPVKVTLGEVGVSTALPLGGDGVIWTS